MKTKHNKSIEGESGEENLIFFFTFSHGNSHFDRMTPLLRGTV